MKRTLPLLLLSLVSIVSLTACRSMMYSAYAQAIAALGGESAKIQADVARLIEDMNASIARADEFIRQMPK